ncbi:MAG: calcium-translocating P-type ATPase, PMCA-type [Christensenellales bacterium]|jgi:Ca2+-transporting ATPase
MANYFDKDIDTVFSLLHSSPNGLSSKDAEERLQKEGRNTLEEPKKKSLFKKFLGQLTDVMIIVLIAAALVSGIIAIVQREYSELIEGALILVIVIVNAIIGLVQDNKAEAALDALKNLNKPFAMVRRDGHIKEIKGEEIVPGDIVILKAGDIVPADIRLCECSSLKIDESALTGESVPIEKHDDTLSDSATPLGDRKNMAYSSGIVSYGKGWGVVTATGMNTEVGKIARMLSDEQQTQTPLQTQLAKTAKALSLLVLIIAVIIFAASLIRKADILDAFMLSVAIAVAAIPEGLPAVVTIVLAIGVQRMSKQNAIVRNLPAVETLGCCEVICSDKTGTLTLNQMTIKQLYTPGDSLYGAEEKKADDPAREYLIKAMALCNDSVLDNGKIIGDPTENALLAYLLKIDRDPVKIIADNKHLRDIPFDSARKLMTSVHTDGKRETSYTKGAFDVLIKRCTHIYDGKVRRITAADIEKLNEANLKMTRAALRVLAFAVKGENLEDMESLESGLTFIGLAGMIDPPRPEVKRAVEVCKGAGMTPIMITGDHMETARAIAAEIGILEEDSIVISGPELDRLPEEEFRASLMRYRVFARVSPENKVRIVKAFQSLNKVVAMTGDGVNDAPGIKSADIGIGMGITGTEVSKGASDMVLADDNFATIVAAAEEGRKVFSNIKKAIQFLLSSNISEVLTLFIVTVILDMPFLTPVMILWVNLVTDGLPALALGMEKAEPDIMKYPPRKSGASLFAGEMGINIVVQGVFQTILVLAAFLIGNYLLAAGIADHTIPMTMAFVTLCLIQLFHSFNMRSARQSLFSSNPFENSYINKAFLTGILLLFAVVMVPFLNSIFNTVMLNLTQWLICLGCAVLIIPLVEAQKAVMRKICPDKRCK